MSLPAVVEQLLLDVVGDGFVVYCCGARDAPTALAASYEWEHCVDLVTILVHPRHSDAPTVSYPAPPSLHIPRHEQRPMTIRLPSPGHAGVRPARLTRLWFPNGVDTRATAADRPRCEVMPR